MCEDPDVAGVVLCAGHLCWGGGIWARDPESACRRAGLLARRSENASSAFSLGDTRLTIDSRHGRLVAVAISSPSLDYLGHAVAHNVHQFAAKRLMPVRPGYPATQAEEE
jgi:hypothetical protein